MADTYTFKPVIRLPKRKPSVISITQEAIVQSDLMELKTPLVSDTLFLGTLPHKIKESDIRTLLQHCMPTEIIFDTDKNKGYLRFSSVKIADRAYSLYNGFTFTNDAKLELQMYQDGSLDPEATAGLVQINNLPDYFDDNKLYDVFRPFGPLNLCKCIMREGVFAGTAFIQFFKQNDSDEAERKLHGQILQDHEIAFLPIIPSNPSTSTNNTQTTSHTPKEAEEKQADNGVVDFMNLYIKNLEPNITNQDLSQAFRRFGRIISARVMTNPATGQSKGYGFVSFGRPEEAAAALYEMNGFLLNNRPLIVNYHEPKKGSRNRQDITPPSFYDNRSHVDMRSVNANHQHPSTLQPPLQPDVIHMQHSLQQQHGFELNNSNNNNSMGLKGISPIEHHKPATINLPSKKSNEAMQHVNIKLSPQFSSSPMSGTSGTGKSLASLASGFSIQQPPIHLQQQQQQQQRGARPTLRRRGSLESVMTESSANLQRIKLEAAVKNCGDYGRATMDIVDMLLTLKRKERSLCLFNPDFLKEKVQLALDALNTCDEEDDSDQDEDHEAMNGVESHVEELGFPVDFLKNKSNNSTANIYKSYNMGRPSLPVQPPRRESKAITITAPPPPVTPATSADAIAAATAAKAVKENNNPKVNKLLASLEGKPIHEKKQLLGDELFPLVKSTGTKQAPKVTICLLDTVNLAELAEIMYDANTLKKRVQDAFATLQ